MKLHHFLLSLSSLFHLALGGGEQPESKTNLPLSFTIPSSTTECLYEHITNPHEHITSSLFLLSGDELRAAYTMEGPVAPVDIDTNGRELQKYISIYNQQGTKMFVNGRYGDSMVNVVPVLVSGVVDMEAEVEDYEDDVLEEMERMEEMKRRFEQAKKNDYFQPHHRQEVNEEGQRYQEMKRDMEEMKEQHPDMDDYAIVHEEMLKRQMEEEAMLDDDFIKLQMNHEAHGGGGGRGRRLQEEVEQEEPQQQQQLHEQQHRRLTEVEKLIPGEPFQKTVKAESPGWYRLCVTAKWGTIEIEMELRKSSTYGPINPHTGHVPGSDASMTHTEIHHLYEAEEDDTIRKEVEGAIQTEDLATTKEQLRILEKVYQEIITKQLEERRVWNWRTIKNQHLYSHLVLGNLVETVVYCVISGYQVFTIRKWFGGGPSLGR